MMNLTMNKRSIAAAAAAAAIALGALPAGAADAEAGPVPAAKRTAQAVYGSPEEAAKALYQAVKSHDVRLVHRVLGPGSDRLIYTGDRVADRQMGERLIAAYERSVKIEQSGDAKATLLVGDNDFPFPYPLVKTARGWRFDAKAGAEEIINRRIGENEELAIEACLGYGDAQREYAEVDRNGTGLLEYAQKFRSSPGKQDGLYWATAEGEPPSPLGPLFARAKKEGYSTESAGIVPFHGYYYRILTAQGKDAPGGAYDYMVRGHMIGGFGLVAYPARWGASGVMTFICNQDGVVYQKDLGPDTAKIASKMKLFNPDKSWKEAE